MNHICSSILGFLLSLLVVAATAGCSRTKPDAALTRVSAIVSDDPERAVAMLDSIDTGKLTDADRHLHDFLTIKALDKAYVTHESDSLILDVIDYYSSRPKDPIYTESLYYGGRVYTDLGDYPTALRYYHNALDNLDVSTDTTNLSVRLNSQIGMLLEKLWLFDKAIPYLEEVLRVGMQDRDSVDIVYTLQRLGGISYECGKYDKADSILTRSLDYAVTLPESYSALSKVWLSAVKLEEGDLTMALALIRNSLPYVKPVSRDIALAQAADIYCAAGILDTAYMYAHELATNENMTNRKTGYRILTSPEFGPYLHPDTLRQYYINYKSVLEDEFNDNHNQLALLQKSKYDYSLHERDSLKVRKEKEWVERIASFFAILVVILAFAVLYIKYQNKSNLVRLHEALDNLEVLQKTLKTSSQYGNENSLNEQTHEHKVENSEEELIQRMRQQLLDMSEDSDQLNFNPAILKSDVYSEIQALLMSEKIMKGDVWNELERVVSVLSPDFIMNLRLLTQNKLTRVDRQTALLIKCGFRSSDMCILLGISHGAVGSRRNSLGMKILGKKTDAQTINNVIRLL